MKSVSIEAAWHGDSDLLQVGDGYPFHIFLQHVGLGEAARRKRPGAMDRRFDDKEIS